MCDCVAPTHVHRRYGELSTDSRHYIMVSAAAPLWGRDGEYPKGSASGMTTSAGSIPVFPPPSVALLTALLGRGGLSGVVSGSIILARGI